MIIVIIRTNTSSDTCSFLIESYMFPESSISIISSIIQIKNDIDYLDYVYTHTHEIQSTYISFILIFTLSKYIRETIIILSCVPFSCIPVPSLFAN